MLDQEDVKKRMSQIELDINQMNKMIDENLQLGENDGHDSGTEGVEGAVSEEVDGQAGPVEPVVTTAAEETSETKDIEHEQVTNEGMAKEVEDASESSVQATEQAQDQQAGTNEETNTFKTESMPEPETQAPEVNDLEMKEPETVEPETVEPETVEPEMKEPVIKETDALEPEMKHAEIPPQATTEKQPARHDEWEDVEEEEFNEIDTSTESNKVIGDTKQAEGSSVLAAGDLRGNVADNGNLTPVTDIDDAESTIFIPKKQNQNSELTEQMKETLRNTRRTTNPFRVISVSSSNSSTNSSRKSSGQDMGLEQTPSEQLKRYEQRHYYLTTKCGKIQKEIDYLNKMNSQGTLSIDDSRKLTRAIAKLQEYLDKKNKERYEVGVLLSRQLRRDINRGENGEFWIGTK
ncbi:Hypothetical protein J6898_03063 [Nakaseomyces glabratus]